MKSKKAKVLHRAGGRALIEHVVDTALQLTSAERIFVVVGHQAAEVQALVKDRRVRFVMQQEQKGTGHAVMMARDVTQPHVGCLLVLYGDVPLLTASTLRTLITTQAGSDCAATIITTCLDDPTGYGRVIRAPDGTVQAIVEQRAATAQQFSIREINSGIYCFDAALLWKHIGEIQPNNPAREFYLTDIVEIFRRAGLRVQALQHDNPRELLGINTREELAAVDGIFRETAVQQLMRSGVTVEKPDTVVVDLGVSVGMDTVIEPFAQILGQTTVGSDCHIGAGSIICDSQIADGCFIGPYTIITESRLESGAVVGPYARLRTGTVVGENARVGNFVEVKKTHIGPGTKAMHLAYLGDAIVGSEVNVGAGAITCNYDGYKKHETRVGDRAFIGSNVTLVAPLEVGSGSFVAAGSVITESVPEDALAITRTQQVNKPGWARRRREQHPE